MNIVDMLGDMTQLNEYIEKEVLRRTELAAAPRYRSEHINELAGALAAAQGEYVDIPYNRTNLSWSDEYTDLDMVMHHIRPVLSKNGLSLNQWTELTSDGGTILHSELMHSSGQWKESRIKVVPSRNDIQTFDSVMADYRRQQAIGLLGVTLQGDPKDDDGQKDMAINYKENIKGGDTKLVRSKESFDCISQEQLEELELELDGFPQLAEEVMTKYKLRALSDMPRTKIRFSLEQIRKLKGYYKK